MSEATLLNTLLATSPEVSALEANDRLLVVAADGSTKRINRNNLAAQGSYASLAIPTSFKGGWVRLITSWTEDSTLLHISSTWYAVSTMSVLLNINSHISAMSQSGGVSGVVKVSEVNGQGITKARLVKTTDNRIFTDIYLTGAPGHVSVRILSTRNAALSLAVDPVIGSSDVVKEFSLVSVGGGVNGFATVAYNFTAQEGKGGLHERGENTRHLHGQGTLARRSDLPWDSDDNGCNGVGVLPDPARRYRRHPIEYLSLRGTRGDEHSLVYPAKLLSAQQIQFGIDVQICNADVDRRKLDRLEILPPILLKLGKEVVAA